MQYRSTVERLRRSIKPPLPLFQGLSPHTQRSIRELSELTPWHGSGRRSTWPAAPTCPRAGTSPRCAAVAPDGAGRLRHRYHALARAPRSRARHRRTCAGSVTRPTRASAASRRWRRRSPRPPESTSPCASSSRCATVTWTCLSNDMYTTDPNRHSSSHARHPSRSSSLSPPPFGDSPVARNSRPTSQARRGRMTRGRRTRTVSLGHRGRRPAPWHAGPRPR